jgi:hypothetical protein
VIPIESKRRRLAFHRNRSAFLVGLSWSHYHAWEERLTHFYLGWWVLTLTTGGEAQVSESDG